MARPDRPGTTAAPSQAPATPGQGLAAPAEARTLTGAQALVAALERLGVDVVFGIPGGAILPAYDPLFDSRSVRHILVRHEQGAGHAAAGYAQVTGRPGVCMATSGPGATNLVTPLADAYMDSVPVVAITGQVPSGLIGTDGFQEADIAGITLPVTKHNFLVTRADDIARTVAEAFHVAATGRPGPVLVDIAKDALQADHHLPLAGPVRPARLPPGDPAAFAAGAGGGPDDDGRPAAGAVRRWRGDQGGRQRGTARAGRAHRHARGHHPDGPRRLPQQSPRRTWACPACTARWQRSAHCRRRTCWWRSGPGSTTG